LFQQTVHLRLSAFICGYLFFLVLRNLRIIKNAAGAADRRATPCRIPPRRRRRYDHPALVNYCDSS